MDLLLYFFFQLSRSPPGNTHELIITNHFCSKPHFPPSHANAVMSSIYNKTKYKYCEFV